MIRVTIWSMWRRRLRRVPYLCIIWLADLLEDMFWRQPKPIVYPPSKASTWTREELFAKIAQSEPLEGSWAEERFRCTNVHELDDATIAKYALTFLDEPPTADDEECALELVAGQTTIPVPRVHAIAVMPSCIALVMDRIPGERLDRAWPALPWWAKLRVAWTLRSYVRQLRRIAPPDGMPGPLGARPRLCHGATFWDARAGPFETRNDFFAYVRRDVFAMEYARRDVAHLIREHEPLVFTHHDLNMRNIILGEDGNVWLVDFAWSGFYPVYFEYIAMAMAAQERGEATDHPWSWRILCPFIADPFLEEAWYRVPWN